MNLPPSTPNDLEQELASIPTIDAALATRLAMAAAERGQLDELKALALVGADLRAVDGAGRSLAMIAARAGAVECLEFLARQGADWSVKDHQGWTALDNALFAGQLGAVDAMGRLGVDFSLRHPVIGTIKAQRMVLAHLERGQLGLCSKTARPRPPGRL